MLPRLSFLPTEYNGHPNPMADPQQAAQMLVSIGKTAAAAGVQNVQPAAFLDASDLASWSGVVDCSLAAILCINVGKFPSHRKSCREYIFASMPARL